MDNQDKISSRAKCRSKSNLNKQHNKSQSVGEVNINDEIAVSVLQTTEIADSLFTMDSSSNDIYGFGSLVSPILSLPFARTNQMELKYKANLIGEKIVNPTIHLCDTCNLPILIYGRMIPCKHVFCYDCAHKSEKICLRCNEEIFKIEKCNLGSVYMCRNESCKRTYLSQRDLEAHIKHRHVRKNDISLRV